MIFKIYNRVSDVEMFGGKWAKQARVQILHGICGEMPAGHDRRPEKLRLPGPRHLC